VQTAVRLIRIAGAAIVVFSDLVASTALPARLGDDRMDRVRRIHVEDVDREVAAGGGRVAGLSAAALRSGWS
jgi:class 3 adenylate cyclase